MPDAEARRLGGGSSFGMQRDSGIFKKPAAPTTSPTTANRSTAAPNSTPQKRSWLAPLAGLAAGLGIAALLSHFGLGEEFAGIVMLMLLIFFGMFILRRLFGGATSRPSERMSYAGMRPPAAEQADTPLAFDASQHAAGSGVSGLDTEAFERQAKLNFIRLQAASDAGNLDDIRAFTTPEVYAEIAMQLEERGGATDQTDVIELGAEVLDVSEESGRYVVTVRFDGLLREGRDAAPAPFTELWHLVKPKAGSDGWRVAGIQQS